MKKKSPETEDEFLENYDASRFEHPSVTVDIAVLTAEEGRLHAVVIRRPDHPHKDHWALPGTFVGMAEALRDAARRALREKTGITDVWLEQLFTFGGPERDPRTRVISITYYALVDAKRLRSMFNKGSELARVEVPWAGETGGAVDLLDADGKRRPVAFDHADILGLAVKRIRGKLNYSAIGFQLLPPSFTLRRLQEVHETVLGRTVNKDSFRRRLLASGDLEATGDREADVGHRPAELYRFVRRSAI